MAKKIKPKNLLDGSSIVLEQTTNEQNAQIEADQIDNGPNDAYQQNSLAGATMTAAEREKLDKYDALEKTVLDLTSKNEVLESKIAEYIEKAEEYTKSSDEINKLKAKIAKLEAEAKNAKPSNDDAKLERECKMLREEADGYLVKISELTFENANLTCQLEETKKKLASKGNSVVHKPMPKTREYRNNGYDSWN